MEFVVLQMKSKEAHISAGKTWPQIRMDYCADADEFHASYWLISQPYFLSSTTSMPSEKYNSKKGLLETTIHISVCVCVPGLYIIGASKTML